jgi:chemotaxis protein MotB
MGALSMNHDHHSSSRTIEVRRAWRATGAVAAVLLLASGLAGCVSTSRYDEAVKSANERQAELVRARTGLEERARVDNERINALMADLARHDKILEADEEHISACDTRVNTLKDALEVTSNMNAALRRAQTAAIARSELYRQLAHKLKNMIDAGQLSIGLRDGRMVLQMPNDVLFDTGSATVKPSGLATLKEVAEVLRGVPDRHFQVAGHTDNVPIHNDRFPSNWELSSERAIDVVRVLVQHGLRPALLSAAGYGEFAPLFSNDAPEARAKNRRTEIVVQPNIDEVVGIPEP